MGGNLLFAKCVDHHLELVRLTTLSLYGSSSCVLVSSRVSCVLMWSMTCVCIEPRRIVRVSVDQRFIVRVGVEPRRVVRVDELHHLRVSIDPRRIVRVGVEQRFVVRVGIEPRVGRVVGVGHQWASGLLEK